MDSSKRLFPILYLLFIIYFPPLESHQTFHQGYFQGHFNGIQPTCEPIKIGLCQGMGYNETMMPNMVGHDVQSDADALLQTFTPLIQYGCSGQLKLFLCSSYVPMCTDKVAQPIGPCRDLCQSVRSSCEPVLLEFGFTWPASLDCNLFHPENNHLHMCIPMSVQPPPGSTAEDKAPELGLGAPGEGKKLFGKGGDEGFLPAKETRREEWDEICGRKIWSRGQCWTRCGTETGRASSPFSQQDKNKARHCLFFWAILSLVGATVAVLAATTFARGLSSPAERPIVYMGVCQMLYSVGVIIGLSGSVATHCVHDKVSGIQVLAQGALVPPVCSLVFLLTFFFSTAATLWWVMLSLSWLLSVNKSFGSSLEVREWSMYHLITWGISSMLTCTVLLNKHVDADELTALCGVGFQDAHVLMYYHLIPLICCVGTSLFFLLTGMCIRYRRRGPNYEYVGRVANFTNMQHKRLTEKSKATWNRVLIFSLIHLLLSLAQFVTTFLEHQFPMSHFSPTSTNAGILLWRRSLAFVTGATACLWIIWLYFPKLWLDWLSQVQLQLSCKNVWWTGSKRSGDVGSVSRASWTSNVGCRSLPALPEERLPMPVQVRTETWRRGETIV